MLKSEFCNYIDLEPEESKPHLGKGLANIWTVSQSSKKYLEGIIDNEDIIISSKVPIKAIIQYKKDLAKHVIKQRDQSRARSMVGDIDGYQESLDEGDIFEMFLGGGVGVSAYQHKRQGMGRRLPMAPF